MNRDPASADLVFTISVDFDILLLQALLRTHVDVWDVVIFHEQGGIDWPATNSFYVWLTNDARRRLDGPGRLLAAIAGQNPQT